MLSTILAVDDDIAALSSMTATLEGAGYAVQRMTTLANAREALDMEEPNLVLLEVDIERGAGWTLLKDIVRLQGPPTIVVTHRGREEEIVEALNIGAVDVLTKPFRSNELLARVRSRLPTPAAPVTANPTSFDPTPLPAYMQPPSQINQPAPTTEPLPATMLAEDPSLPIGVRLRAARQQRKLSLVQVNLQTKIPIWYLQAMEEEKFSLLPRGTVAQEMVRGYANYLQLDTERALAEYRSHHDEQPWQPLPYLGGRPDVREPSRWRSMLIAALLALVIGLGIIWFFARDQLNFLQFNISVLLAL